MNSLTISIIGGSGGSLPREQQDNHEAQMKTSRNVLLGRCLFIGCLVIVAALLGALGWFFLTQSETQLANSKFESIAERALTASTEIVVRKRLGTVTMASIVANAFRDASEWPFVALNGYEEIANNIIATSSGRSMGLIPFVAPAQLQEWEDFAYNYLENAREPAPFPNATGWSSFGKGVWGTDPSSDAPDKRYKEKDGSTNWGSPNKLLSPMIQHNTGPHYALMMNVRFQEARGVPIDDVISCAEMRAQAWRANQSYDIRQHECGSVTGMLKLPSQAPEDGPAALLFEPIYPARDNTTLTGVISSTIVWEEALTGLFGSDVSGVDCVIRTEQGAFTYTVQNGIPQVKGPGDLHEAQYTSYDWSTEITPPGLFSRKSPTYTLEIYPSRAFFVTYSTPNPWIASVGAVLIILITSALFFLYDYCVRKEFDSQKELLEAKRMFVRFISHEVRTPLNTVCMGLCLLQEEMNSVLTTTQRSPQTQQLSAQSRCAKKADAPVPPLFASLSEHSSSGSGMESASKQNKVSELLSQSMNISTATDELALKRDDALDWVHLCQEIYDNAQAAVDVLNDLLNYDKIQMGTLSLEYGVLAPLAQLLDKTVVQEFRLMAVEKRVDLQLHIDKDTQGRDEEAEDPRVIGDHVRVIQVLRNLISNGLKFTPAGGSLTVTMSTTYTDTMLPSQKKISSPLYGNFSLSNGESISVRYVGYATINVMDTGVGMTSQQVESVFQEGTQFNPGKLQAGNGSGLGMYIAKGIAVQHGGDLAVSSLGLGCGTTFSLTLPLYENPNPPAPTALMGSMMTTASTVTDEEHGHSVPPAPPTPATGDSQQSLEPPPPLEILVVDDSPSNRKLLMRLLRNRGHKCSEAADGYEAYNLVKKRMGLTKPETSPAGAAFRKSNFQFDCILMDYEMPVMNGPTSCSKIRKIGCSTFIVGITGNVMPEDVELFKSNGANAVLPKPFKIDALEELLVEYDVFPVHQPDNGTTVVSASRNILPDLSLRSASLSSLGGQEAENATPEAVPLPAAPPPEPSLKIEGVLPSDTSWQEDRGNRHAALVHDADV